MARTFQFNKAERAGAKILFAFAGPSSSGKTKSALRLATGIAGVIGKPVYVIDTECNRALHYAEQHQFIHVPFDPPFSPSDYQDAIAQTAAQKPAVIVIDSMSHEHEGVGGVLEMHEAEVQRMAGNDEGKRQRVSTASWIKPKAARRKLLNQIVQTDCHFIFCFRANEKMDWKNKAPNGQPIDLGFQPVAAKEFIYEMTAMALFQPGSNGTPVWQPTIKAEQSLVKLPNYLAGIFRDGRQIDEAHGEAIARWAIGEPTNRTPKQQADPFEQYKAALRKDKTIVAALREVPRERIDGLIRESFDRNMGETEFLQRIAEVKIEEGIA